MSPGGASYKMHPSLRSVTLAAGPAERRMPCFFSREPACGSNATFLGPRLVVVVLPPANSFSCASLLFAYHQTLAEVRDAHSRGGEINCVRWHPKVEGLLVSASDDGSVKLWRFQDSLAEGKNS